MGSPQTYDAKPDTAAPAEATETPTPTVESAELDAIADAGTERIQANAAEDMAELDAGIETPAEPEAGYPGDPVGEPGPEGPVGIPAAE